MFQRFKKRRTLNILPSFDAFPTRLNTCPYCTLALESFENYNSGTEDTDRAAGELIEYCLNCTFWQVHGLRLQSFEARSTVVNSFDISVLSAKVREFEEEYPPGSLGEVAQWLRRHPEKYNNMTPRYLEVLVAQAFSDAGLYTEVQHVGRPGDGGVDVLLVDAEGKSWLVQVKRRESAVASEPVSTIRSILGTMVVKKARHGIVVSTADRFTSQAQMEASQAARSHFTVELIDRHALDRLISRAMPMSPWVPILEEVRSARDEWINEIWCFCGCSATPVRRMF